MESKTGYRAVLNNYYGMYLKTPDAKGVPELQAARKVESWMPPIMVQECSSLLQVPTFCTSSYGSMLTTMAAAAPKNTLTIPAISQREGLLVFEDPFTLELPGDTPDIVTVRAFSWYSFPNAGGSGTVSVSTRVWTESKCAPASLRVPSRHKLFSSPLARTNVGMQPRSGTDDMMTRVLQAHFALLKSPLSADERGVRDPKVSPRTKRSLGDTLRRVYLRRPEVAAYEADEAAAAREGRAPMRAHWVRGHWRNQHFSRSGENRWIWIDGFIKGNVEAGTMVSRKVAVARASASELRKMLPA